MDSWPKKSVIKYDAGFTKSYVNNLWMKAKPRAKVYFESGVGRVHQASQIRVICEICGYISLRNQRNLRLTIIELSVCSVAKKSLKSNLFYGIMYLTMD